MRCEEGMLDNRKRGMERGAASFSASFRSGGRRSEADDEFEADSGSTASSRIKSAAADQFLNSECINGLPESAMAGSAFKPEDGGRLPRDAETGVSLNDSQFYLPGRTVPYSSIRRSSGNARVVSSPSPMARQSSNVSCSSVSNLPMVRPAKPVDSKNPHSHFLALMFV